MKFAVLIMILSAIVYSMGCEIGPESGSGLRLPTGDVIRGEQAFHGLGCVDCHAIGGESEAAQDPGGRLIVVLGGKVAHIESHGELVTSIVNPSHGFSGRYPREQVTEADRSRMKNFNQTMTVEELINLTAYLQSKYELELNQVYAP
jgi:sulfur-oxidizing protein SoxX